MSCAKSIEISKRKQCTFLIERKKNLQYYRKLLHDTQKEKKEIICMYVDFIASQPSIIISILSQFCRKKRLGSKLKKFFFSSFLLSCTLFNADFISHYDVCIHLIFCWHENMFRYKKRTIKRYFNEIDVCIFSTMSLIS